MSRPLAARRRAQRHVLEVGLIGRGPPRQERVARLLVFGVVVGVVVVDLVIVPGDDERDAACAALEDRVAAIERVASRGSRRAS